MIDYRDGEPTAELLRLERIHKEILAKLADYCGRHGVQWFLVAGSAIGAVRHGDVIPWDDDVDVGLLRDDYDRLCALLAREPIPGTFLQDCRNQPGYPLAFAKLRLDGSYLEEPDFKDTAFHRGISIDLFPFDRLPRNALLRAVQRGALG